MGCEACASSTTSQKRQFCCDQLCLESKSRKHTKQLEIQGLRDWLAYCTEFVSTVLFSTNRAQPHSAVKGDIILRAPKWVPLLVLVSPCFRENVIVTCKIVSFLCSLAYFFLKNVIVFFFFGNQISKCRSFEKRAIFDLLFTFFNHQGNDTKIPSAHISLTYIHVFCSPY